MASGNPYLKLQNCFPEIKDELTYIAENGGYIIDQGEELFSAHLSTQDSQLIIDALKTMPDVLCWVCTKEQSYTLETLPEQYYQMFLPYFPNVCILQCALFAKGYNAGGITGVYYTTGVSAVKEFQEDANLEVTGIIDWKVWMGLVSLNWFNKTSGGKDKIIQIQQQLNADWSDIIGVGPCDGVVSRFTAYALIAALQAAEGIYTDFIGTSLT